MPIKHKSNYYQKKRCHASASDPHLRGFILQDTSPSPTRRANGAHGKRGAPVGTPLDMGGSGGFGARDYVGIVD